METIARSRSGEVRLLWSWYHVGGRYTTSRLQAKLLQVLDLSLQGDPGRAAAFVMVSTPTTSTELPEARQALAGIDGAMLPRLKDAFAGVDKSP